MLYVILKTNENYGNITDLHIVFRAESFSSLDFLSALSSADKITFFLFLKKTGEKNSK